MTARARTVPEPVATTVVAPDIRTRTVKRHIAACPFEGCDFDDRNAPRLHKTVGSADVEAANHIRETHALDLSRIVKVNKQVVVTRRVISEEIAR